MDETLCTDETLWRVLSQRPQVLLDERLVRDHFWRQYTLHSTTSSRPPVLPSLLRRLEGSSIRSDEHNTNRRQIGDKSTRDLVVWIGEGLMKSRRPWCCGNCEGGRSGPLARAHSRRMCEPTGLATSSSPATRKLWARTKAASTACRLGINTWC